MKQETERNNAIITAYLSGVSSFTIAAEHGISPQRVQSIIAADGRVSGEFRQRRQARLPDVAS